VTRPLHALAIALWLLLPGGAGAAPYEAAQRTHVARSAHGEPPSLLGPTVVDELDAARPAGDAQRPERPPTSSHDEPRPQVERAGGSLPFRAHRPALGVDLPGCRVLALWCLGHSTATSSP